MSTGAQEASASSTHSIGPSLAYTAAQNAVPTTAAEQTSGSIQFRNGITSPASPGSEADSTINSTAFAPSLLASRLGRDIYSSAAAASSALSISGSGFNSPTLALTGFNAISTVLNNPSKRQHPIDPKSSRFPPVTPNHVPAEIPKVKKAELDPYLSSVRPEWDRFMRNQSMGRQGKATIEQQQLQQQQQQQQQSLSSTQDSSYDSDLLENPNLRHRTTSSIASLSSDLQALPPPQPRKRLPNLSAVPQFFFSEDFDLGNPYTFDQVTERYKTAVPSPGDQNGAKAPTYDVALNQMLQEKLSYYSDVIEQHLIIEIGQQSSSFFAALENLNDLNAEAESCLAKIHHLKSELESIDKNQAKKGLRIIQQQQHRQDLERKQTVIQSVRQLVERRDLIRLLLQQGETEEALDLLNKLRATFGRPAADHALANTEHNGTRTADDEPLLSDLQSLASIPAQLDEMEQTLSGMLEQDLVAILKQDLDARLATYTKERVCSMAKPDSTGSSPTPNTVQHSQSSLNSDATITEPSLTPSKTTPSSFTHDSRMLSSADAELASRIAPIVVGLARTGGIEATVSAYREVAIQAVQETWKATLSQSSAEMAETVKWLLAEELSKFDDREDLPAPAARIRDLKHASFLNIGQKLFEILMECLKAIDAQCKLVLRILDDLASGTSSVQSPPLESESVVNLVSPGTVPASDIASPPTMPSGVPTTLPARLSEVVVASAEQAHTLCARLLSLRAKTHAALELPPFLVVFQLCWSFVLSSEQLCRKMIVGLRATVLGQAKGFLANFHRRRIERAAKAVEEETWAQADVDINIQAQIRLIVSSAVQDPSEFVVTGGESRLDAPAKAAGDHVADQETATISAKTLDIENRQYFVVDASLDVLALLVDYLKVIINLPLLTTEAMARVVEFLKQFNSRTCQVVLGAGAMRSAGLKNITAKHLALASQSLSIMISLIPYIRETVRRHLSPKQAVMLTEFDKLRRDFQEHQYEIHAKLVAIMSDRLTVHCRTLSALDWNADNSAADQEQQGGISKDPEPNKYAADLVKETATLHKVLTKYLQAVVVEHVIGQVLCAIDTRIAQELDKIPIQNQQALDRMQTDVRYLGTKLSVLKHVEWKDEALQQVLAAKHVPNTPAVTVTASTGSSTPNGETVPGSPARDKPVASPFGPVTYKPRIPNIFSRRQQQQLSQAASPRGSTDAPGSTTPAETQRSVESTPRTSLQLQQQQSQSATTAQAAGVVQEAIDEAAREVATPATEPSIRPSTSAAQSVEEEVNNVPPTPPSKNVAMQSTAVVKTEDKDAAESEDSVVSVVPAPDAAAKVLSESDRVSSELTATAPTLASMAAAESVQQEDANGGQDTKAVSGDQQDQATESADVPATSQSATGKQADHKVSMEAPQHDDTARRVTNTSSVGTFAASEPIESQRPSTPKKDRHVASAYNGQGGIANSTEASPVRSGASTPAATPTSTPAKPARMSLKERLAEAARKRAQQSSSSAAQPPNPPGAPTTPTAPAQPSETAPVEPALAPADKVDKPVSEQKVEDKNVGANQIAEPVESSAETNTLAAPRDASFAKREEVTAKTELAPSPQVEENALMAGGSEPVAASKQEPKEEGARIASSVVSEQDASGTRTDAPATEAAEAIVPVGSIETSGGISEQTEVIVQSSSGADAAAEVVGEADGLSHTGGDDQQIDAKLAEIQDAPSATSDSVAAVTASKDSAMTTEEAADDRDGDDIGDDADGDGDTNETTNDSAVGSGPSTGSKKNKKKKKKAKKK